MRRSCTFVVLVAGLATLHCSGRGELALPSLAGADLMAWIDERGAVVAAFAILRVVALAAGWYLVAIFLLAAGARRASLFAVAARLDRLTLPGLRAIAGGAGISTLAALAGVIAPAAADPSDPIADRLVEVTPHATDAPPTMRVSGIDVETTTSVPPAAPEVPTTATTAPPPTSTTVAASPATSGDVPVMRRLAPAPTEVAAAVVERDTWTIEPGDSFWSVAQDHLRDKLGRAPDDREVARYWRELMAANPDASPTGDPDLLYSGTVLVLPAS